MMNTRIHLTNPEVNEMSWFCYLKIRSASCQCLRFFLKSFKVQQITDFGMFFVSWDYIYVLCKGFPTIFPTSERMKFYFEKFMGSWNMSYRFLTCCDLVTTNSLPSSKSPKVTHCKCAGNVTSASVGPRLHWNKQHNIHHLYLVSTSGWMKSKLQPLYNFLGKEKVPTAYYSPWRFPSWSHRTWFARFCLWILSADGFKLSRGHICAQWKYVSPWPVKKGGNSIA